MAKWPVGMRVALKKIWTVPGGPIFGPNSSGVTRSADPQLTRVDLGGGCGLFVTDEEADEWLEPRFAPGDIVRPKGPITARGVGCPIVIMTWGGPPGPVVYVLPEGAGYDAPLVSFKASELELIQAGGPITLEVVRRAEEAEKARSRNISIGPMAEGSNLHIRARGEIGPPAPGSVVTVGGQILPWPPMPQFFEKPKSMLETARALGWVTAEEMLKRTDTMLPAAEPASPTITCIAIAGKSRFCGCDRCKD